MSDANTQIRVQTELFDAGIELARISQDPGCGAVVSFSGLVRDANLGDQVSSLFLEHYPGMTEKALQQIVEQARERWQLGPVTVIHRVGKLYPNDPIVFVGVASAHRGSAFQAAEFLMDFLKTKAPFWKKESWKKESCKKEQTEEESRWLDIRESDIQSAARWE